MQDYLDTFGSHKRDYEDYHNLVTSKDGSYGGRQQNEAGW